MFDGSFDRPPDYSSDLRRAALLTFVVLGGAAAAVGIAAYLSNRSATERVAVGSGESLNVDAWLKRAVDHLQRGTQEVVDSLDPSRSL